MTALIARLPLETLSMSSLQSGSRRHSARLQGKDGVQSFPNSMLNGANESKTREVAKPSTTKPNSKKRRNEYDEEDDGFTFTRVKKKRPRTSGAGTEAKAALNQVPPVSQTPIQTLKRPIREEAAALPAQETNPTERQTKRRKKLSFSTPVTKEPKPVRKSKRLSNEEGIHNGSPRATAAPGPAELVPRKQRSENHPAQNTQDEPKNQDVSGVTTELDLSKPDEESHAATKISLPFADTPVISRNKAMRLGKQGKGERRSSLGLRGRRASSLIDSGSSSALPHSEVEIRNFYKHIESDLIEPRRMKQLLTWCGTRAMHAKPQGTNFEDASAKSAVRVIEEELLKELATKSELSDWFSREEIPLSTLPLPERPNPKNVQNSTKIVELEQQIQRLRGEKETLEALLRPPKTRNVKSPAQGETELLSESDAALLESLQASSNSAESIAQRLNSITQSLGPTIDNFTDGVHQVTQYCSAAENVASRILSICADHLARREAEGRKKALHSIDDIPPGQDLMNVLRGLSKADKQ